MGGAVFDRSNLSYSSFEGTRLKGARFVKVCWGGGGGC